ncbi:hypothetical protein M422DRAFT_249658 [Sphaerobolus stellatus SS14]|uniref:Uncharacterized protein n=1 Tax=Sphaerobolus stellatus (strain SS14) TaxID=990650 RepID=A0A0C9VHZ3_SPHS4|nr:hypothetical protein M422DRAFT_249658 [Sphaerobolus stellatus SS14]
MSQASSSNNAADLLSCFHDQQAKYEGPHVEVGAIPGTCFVHHCYVLIWNTPSKPCGSKPTFPVGNVVPTSELKSSVESKAEWERNPSRKTDKSRVNREYEI